MRELLLLLRKGESGAALGLELRRLCVGLCGGLGLLHLAASWTCGGRGGGWGWVGESGKGIKPASLGDATASCVPWSLFAVPCQWAWPGCWGRGMPVGVGGGGGACASLVASAQPKCGGAQGIAFPSIIDVLEAPTQYLASTHHTHPTHRTQPPWSPPPLTATFGSAPAVRRGFSSTPIHSFVHPKTKVPLPPTSPPHAHPPTPTHPNTQSNTQTATWRASRSFSSKAAWT